MNTSVLFWFLLAFQVKHLLADFFLQPAYQYQNKGTYLHRGGIDHALTHAVGTALLLLVFELSFPFVFLAAVLDAVIHYHIDWAKVNLCKYFGWTPTNSEKYWYLLGVDQFLHQLTYVGIIAAAVAA